MTRQIVLDTETTGISFKHGHRIIEIGAVEIIDRKLTGNHYHQYIHPQRDVPPEVVPVHGLTSEFLLDKPSFPEVFKEFIEFVAGSELIIHNAPFDVGFLNMELNKIGVDPIEEFCTITDTLVMAKEIFPGKRNSLDALCNRLHVNNTHRSLHGALLDSEILSEVYLKMTAQQQGLKLINDKKQTLSSHVSSNNSCIDSKIIYASDEEVFRHESKMNS